MPLFEPESKMSGNVAGGGGPLQLAFGSETIDIAGIYIIARIRDIYLFGHRIDSHAVGNGDTFLCAVSDKAVLDFCPLHNIHNSIFRFI